MGDKPRPAKTISKTKMKRRTAASTPPVCLCPLYFSSERPVASATVSGTCQKNYSNRFIIRQPSVGLPKATTSPSGLVFFEEFMGPLSLNNDENAPPA